MLYSRGRMDIVAIVSSRDTERRRKSSWGLQRLTAAPADALGFLVITGSRLSKFAGGAMKPLVIEDVKISTSTEEHRIIRGRLNQFTLKVGNRETASYSSFSDWRNPSLIYSHLQHLLSSSIQLLKPVPPTSAQNLSQVCSCTLSSIILVNTPISHLQMSTLQSHVTYMSTNKAQLPLPSNALARE